MERKEFHSPDSDANWHSHGGGRRNGTDAAGNPILGSPRQPNSIPLIPTATPITISDAPELKLNFASLIINEIAWAGTNASATDEWMELFNPGYVAVDLQGWRLTDSGDIDIALHRSIPAGGYFLLERTDDTTILDLEADLIYNGGLRNDGEQLLLVDPSGNVIDQVDGANGGWPAQSRPVPSGTGRGARQHAVDWTGWSAREYRAAHLEYTLQRQGSRIAFAVGEFYSSRC